MLIFALGPAGRQRLLRWLDLFLLAHLLKKIALLDKGKPGWSMSISMSIGIGMRNQAEIREDGLACLLAG